MIHRQNIFFDITTHLTFTFDFLSCDIGSILTFHIISILNISTIKIQPSVHDLLIKQEIILLIMNIYLNFATLILDQYLYFIYTNNVCKYNQNPTFYSLFIDKTMFLQFVHLNLTFDLLTLTFNRLKCIINIKPIW